jgi:protein O-GlcNAc transferase
MNIDKSMQSAREHQQNGNFQQAVTICKKLLEKNPKNRETLHLLGILYYQLKNYDLAICSIKKEIQINPGDADAYTNLGLALQGTGEYDEAITSFEKALQLDSKDADKYYNLGNTLKQKGRLDEAIAHYQKALQLNPGFVYAYNNLGVILKEKEEFDKAITCFQRALQLDPLLADIHNNLGLSFQARGQFDTAISCFQKALQLNPRYSEAYNNLGVSLQSRGQNDEAIVFYRKAIQLDPNFVKAYNNLGILYYQKGLLDEAITWYQKALQLSPEFYETYNNLGCAYKDRGLIEKAEDWFRRAIKGNKEFSTAYSNLLLTMQYDVRCDARTLYLEHLKFAKQYADPFISTITPHTNDCSPTRRLRIGYISPDFRKHSVSHFIEAVLISHNREHFQVFCYANSFEHDEVTRRLKEHADDWRDIARMSDDKVTELIRKDAIDLLVDLAGHTSGNRILVLPRKPAPVQINWIGYPATTGLSAVDYKIVDNYTDPPGMTEAFYTETLLRLPETFLCYMPDKNSPEVYDLPLLIKGYITFGSFNYYSKVSPEVVDAWAKILQSVPNSHFIMKAKSLADSSTRQHLVSVFEQKGISAARIELLSWAPSTREHLDLYNRVDIGLDTFPYNGTTTTCEALWMGVPVITLAGNMHASRVGASLLSNVGVRELIARTHEEYIDIAIKLANDTARLQLLREGLRNMMKSSALCDAKRFTTNLEKCYRRIWESWCKGYRLQ